MALEDLRDVTRVSGPVEKMGTKQCTATAAGTGERCLGAPMIGSDVCNVHGGSAPTARAAASRRLLELVEPALKTLFKALGLHCEYYFLDNPEEEVPLTPAGKPTRKVKFDRVVLCREHGNACPDWPVRVNAARALMDRAGFGPHSVVSVEDKREGLADKTTEELASELEVLALRARDEAGRARAVKGLTPQTRMNEVPVAHKPVIDTPDPSVVN